MHTASRTCVERNLSNFWRYDRTEDRVRELVSVLQGAEALVGNMGSDIQVVWSASQASFTDLQQRVVALDYAPLRQEACPFPGGAVDEVIGYAAHEGGHCLWTAPGKDRVLSRAVLELEAELPPALLGDWRANERTTLAELCRVQNVLEDAYIDQRVAGTWPVLGEYIRIARSRLKARASIDLAAISHSECPDRNAAINLWVSLSLYGHAMPPGSSGRVRRAMDELLALAQRAATVEDAVARQTIALAAATILWREFPTRGATSPASTRTSVTREHPDIDSQPPPEGVLGHRDSGGGVGSHLGMAPKTTVQDGPASASSTRRDAPARATDDSDRGSRTSEASNLDDFDPSTTPGQGGRQVAPVPPGLLGEVRSALASKIEDLSQPTAQALAEDPWRIAATARRAGYDPALASSVISQVRRETCEVRRAFQLHRGLNSLWRHGLDRGRPDERRLWKPLAGDPTFRKRREATGRPSLAVGLLLDVSGSMRAHMPVVEQAAAVFSQGLRHAPGVDFAAWCYTGKDGRVALTRICDRQMPRLCLAGVEKLEGTPSGVAIAGAKALMGRMRGRSKLLIHFTDGRPDDARHVERAVSACRAAGIGVYAIGLPQHRGALSAQYGAGSYEAVQAVPELPHAVARIVRALGADSRAIESRQEGRLQRQHSF